MRHRPWIACVALGAALTAQDPEPLTLTGKHFALVCHVPDAEVARAALDVVEATWPVAMRLYGAPRKPPPEPLPVHLYRDASAYEAAEAALTGGEFKRNLAFAHFDTRTAHVALQPTLSDEALAAVGLNYQTLRLLVHEAAHLARFHAMPNHRSHPDWFADGNATWIEVEVLRAKKLLGEVEQDPEFSTKVLMVQRLIEQDRLPALPDVLRDSTEKLQFQETYAVRWLVFRFLMTGPRAGKMRKVISDLRSFGGGPRTAERVVAAMQRRFGKAGFEALDAAFRRHVADLRPAWEEVYRSLETAGEDWVQAAFDDLNAIAWRTEPVGVKSFELRGELTILADGGRQLNLLLGRAASGFVSVAFTAGQGVTVFAYDAAANRFDPLGRAPAPGLRVGEPAAFRVRYQNKGELSVDLGGEQLLELDLDHPMDGPWGLGAQAGSTGVWRGLR